MKGNLQKVLLILLGIMISFLVCLGIGKIFYKENNATKENNENVEQNNNLCKNYIKLNENLKDYCKEINNNKNSDIK